MKQRINAFVKGQRSVKALFGLSAAVEQSSLDKSLLSLVYFRVSQINGCAYCLDMHSKDLLAEDETPQRLFLLDAWRESPIYSERERAAFAWAEVVTRLEHADVPDDVYAAATAVFAEEELIDLTMAVIAINSYNRINIAFRIQAGGYKVGAHAVHAD